MLGLVLALALVVTALAAPATAQLNVTGQWTTLPYLAPVNPTHVALLYNGKVLIVDSTAGSFVQQTTPWDLFCNGMSFLPDGRVIIAVEKVDLGTWPEQYVSLPYETATVWAG